jgi:hypothetical protein
MIKFPSIGQFRQVVSEVRFRAAYTGKDELGNPIYAETFEKPKLDFVGTVKLHGTNASVVQKDGEIIVQSRNRVITVDKDNAGFAKFVHDEIGVETWEQFFMQIRFLYEIEESATITIYGEWCGGNIQKGVGIASLDKMFVIFAVRIHENDDTEWLSVDKMMNLPTPNIHPDIKDVFNFLTYEITIDFEEPGLIQNQLVEYTVEVETECPVAKKLGAEGIGEGIVWRCVTPGFEESRFWFKVKGEKHSVTKVKKLVEVDVEKLNSINEFVASVLTEHRLLQGIDYLKEMNLELSRRSTGDYIRWVIGDVRKEESDRLEASGLEGSEVNKRLGARARSWFFNWESHNGF